MIGVGTSAQEQAQNFVSTMPPPATPAELSSQDNPQNPTGDITMTPAGAQGVPPDFQASTQQASPQTVQAPPAQAPPKKGSLGISLIRHIAEALGGSGSEIDPNTGKPVRTSTGALVTQAIGRFGGSVAAGLANSRGPGGATRAAANAFQKQQEFSAEDQQRRYNAMESYRATARQIASLRHQNLGDTKLQQELYENNKAWIESAVGSGGVIANEGDNPVNDTEAKKLFGDLVKSGYSPGSIMMFLGPPQPAAGDPAKTEQTYFLVTPPNKDDKLTINPNTDARADLSKDLGVKVADQQIPPHVLANLLANKTAISTSIEKAQQELAAAGIKDVPRAQVNLGNMRQAMIATQAMKNWQMIHSPYGDIAKDLDTFEKRFPGPGRAWLSDNLYGGKEKEVSDFFATKNMTPDQRIKFEKDQKDLETAKVNLQKAQNEAITKPITDAQEIEKRHWEIENLKIEVSSKQAEADGKKPVPDPEGTSGEAYIAKLPGDMQQTVRNIGTGQMSLDHYTYLVTKNPQLIYAVNNAYPEFSTSKAMNFVKEQGRFEAGGDVGKLILSMGTIAEHARAAYDVVSNDPWKSLSGLWKEGADYNTDTKTLAGDVSVFLKGGGQPGELDTKGWEEAFNPPVEKPWLLKQRGRVIQDAAQRMLGRYHELENQWVQTLPSPKMAATNPIPGISEVAMKNLEYIANGGQVTFDVKMPNNKVANFKTQQEADAFKASLLKAQGGNQ